eukprot:TRINITY_DN3391_c0_g1_i1.p1 TRINITY_DN3391_c0_g1~~TRINITY_DN3391_c0_g1_i1.p1  ORF type:complete len:116 (+),score=40.62 TRINITY_DN3391_c0_g1_i1:150-497(+)
MLENNDNNNNDNDESKKNELEKKESFLNPEFLVNRKTGVWIILVACCLLASSAGTGYAFGLTSQTYKNKFGFSQKEVDIIGSFGNLGLFLSITAGLFYDKFGPLLTAITVCTRLF